MNRPLLSMAALAFAAVATGTAAGCAGGLEALGGKRTVAERLDERLDPELRQQVVIPFEITPELADMARAATVHRAIDYERAIALAEHLISDSGLGIEYSWEGNKTALEVYKSRSGNCMGISNLYVGMARAAGLRAVYVDVLSVEQVRSEGDVIVKSGHITAGVINSGKLTLVDFAPNPERHYQHYRVIDDLEAIANFYNNAGYLTRSEVDQGFATEAARVAEEIASYRMAIAVDPHFVRAHNNLGVSLKQAGKLDEAIAAFDRARDLDPTFAEAWANLASIYDRQGNSEQARQTLEKAARHAGKNPFIFHHLGMLYYRHGDYRRAERSFKRALSRNEKLASTRYMLALTYEQSGKHDKAIEQLQEILTAQADHVAARAKLDQLMEHDKGNGNDHDR